MPTGISSEKRTRRSDPLGVAATAAAPAARGALGLPSARALFPAEARPAPPSKGGAGMLPRLPRRPIAPSAGEFSA